MSNISDQTTKPSKETRLIVDEIGIDTETGIIGKGHSYDNGKTFVVDGTIYGRVYHADDYGKIWKGIQDQVAKVVDPAKSAADIAVSTADAAVASAQVTSDAVTAIASATAEAKQGANDAMSRAKSAWDVATGAKSAVTDFDPLLKSAQSDAGKALTQIADTANTLSETKVALTSDVAVAKNLANAAQTTANNAVESAGENAKALASQANALSDAKKAIDSDVASAKGLASTAQATADNAIKSASSVANDLATVASQAKANANGITKVTSDVGLLQTTVADNSGNISKIQETAAQIQQSVSDNSGAIVAATQTAQSATTVASDAKSNATVAVQTASEASVTAKNAQGDATTAITTAKGAVTQASDAKSNATIAVQTASEASVTATNAQGDASFAKQTASDASVQIKNAQGDISALQNRAGTIEASVASNSGAIADVQVTANQLKASVSDNSGAIVVATQTAQGAVTVASDARSNATVAIQTASQASITASNASGQAASAMLTANGAMTTASDAKSDATVAVQTASGASLTAINAQSDATVAKQTASEATVQASNAESDLAQLSVRANKIEAKVANDSGAIASVQQTANGLTTTVADIKANGGGVNLAKGTDKFLESTTGLAAFIGGLTPEEWKQYEGKTLTFSITIEWKNWQTYGNNRVGWELAFHVGGNTIWDLDKSPHLWINGQANGSSGKKRLSTTITVPENIDDDIITGQTAYIQSHADYFKISDLMVEEGTVAHTWSPAPADLQNQFTQTKQSIDGIATTINDPKTGLNATYQTASGNSTTISNVKSDVYQLEMTASGLTSRVGNLESKTNTQETAIEQNKNAIKLKADQADVDKINGTVSRLQSSLTVQAEQIKEKVTSSQVTGMLTGYATQEYAQGLVTLKADEWNVNLTKLKNDTQTSLSSLAIGVEGVQAQVYNSDGSSKITQLSNLIATKVSSGDYNSQIAQLKDAINLRVAKGDVISQINQEAGGDTLIQVSNGKKSLILDAGNTIITGKAWIPSAAISSIQADQVMIGNSRLFSDNGTLNLVNQNGDLKALIQVKQGLVQNTMQSIISFSSDYNNRAFSVTPVGATITPTLFFERYDQTAGHWLGFTRNEVRQDGLMFHTWDDEGERFFVGCHARFDRNISASGNIYQGTWNGTTGKPLAGVLSIQSGNTIWSGSDFLAIGDHLSNSFTNVVARSFSQQSTLSSKTNIETVDPKYALDLVNRTDIRSYQYKADVAQGKTKRYTSLIIDDVNDVSQYYAPDEFTNDERTGRDDGSAVGYLFLAVQELTRRIKTLEEKLNG